MPNGDEHPPLDHRRILIGRIIHQLIRRGWQPPKKMPGPGFGNLVDDICHIHPSATLELSMGQLEVISLMARGMTYEQAAEELGLTKETIKTHMKYIRQKIGAKNTVEAVAIVIREEIIR